MKKETWLVPAKAMLFGEYAALEGHPCAVMSFFSHHFKISLSSYNNQKINSVTIISPFFSQGSLTLLSPLNQNQTSSSSNDHNESFFRGLFLPWAHEITNLKIEVKVEKAFSPSLGFGSSSALIAGIHCALWSQLKDKPKDEEFWSKLFQSLFLIQGKGSGFDITVQASEAINLNTEMNKREDDKEHFSKDFIAPILHEPISFSPRFFIYEKPKQVIPILVPLKIDSSHLKKFGYFIPTGIYSDTKKHLAHFEEKEKKEFLNEQFKLARSFIENPTLSHTISLMDKSRQLMTRAHFINESSPDIANLIKKLDKNNFAFKTMGAGHGDCLWVMSREDDSKRNLQDVLGFKNLSAFSFESFF